MTTENKMTKDFDRHTAKFDKKFELLYKKRDLDIDKLNEKFNVLFEKLRQERDQSFASWTKKHFDYK